MTDHVIIDTIGALLWYGFSSEIHKECHAAVYLKHTQLHGRHSYLLPPMHAIHHPTPPPPLQNDDRYFDLTAGFKTVNYELL